MLKALRTYLSLRRIRRTGLPRQAPQPLQPLSEISLVAFLVEPLPQQPLEYLITYCQQLQLNGIESQIFTYVPQKDLPKHLIARMQVTVIQPGDLTWLYIPRRATIRICRKQKFDYLIDLAKPTSLPIQWVKAVTSARLRIGFSNATLAEDHLTFPLREGTSIEKKLSLLGEYLNPSNLNG